MIKRRSLLAAPFAALWAGRACADYPSRTVEIIVPYAPGGAIDGLGRAFARGLSQALGANVIVVNRDGASSTIGMATVARSEPDGHTLGFTASGPITIQTVARTGVPYTLESFDPICQVFDLTFALCVRSASPIQTFDDLAGRAKSQPGKLTFGVNGTTTSAHLAAVELFQATGLDLVHVPYRGDAPGALAVQSGDIDVAVIAASVAITQGFRLLGVSSDQRVVEASETPTFRELGVASPRTAIGGLLAPRGLPARLRERIERLSLDVVRSPDFISAATKLQQPLTYRERGEFGSALRRELEATDALLSNGKTKP